MSMVECSLYYPRLWPLGFFHINSFAGACFVHRGVVILLVPMLQHTDIPDSCTQFAEVCAQFAVCTVW